MIEIQRWISVMILCDYAKRIVLNVMYKMKIKYKYLNGTWRKITIQIIIINLSTIKKRTSAGNEEKRKNKIGYHRG